MFNARPWSNPTDSDSILKDLSNRQYLQPHQPVGQTLAASSAALGFCPRAVETALAWLGIDPTQTVGRLRRTELIQLARSIHRFWQQAMVRESEPASH